MRHIPETRGGKRGALVGACSLGPWEAKTGPLAWSRLGTGTETALGINVPVPGSRGH